MSENDSPDRRKPIGAGHFRAELRNNAMLVGPAKTEILGGLCRLRGRRLSGHSQRGAGEFAADWTLRRVMANFLVNPNYKLVDTDTVDAGFAILGVECPVRRDIKQLARALEEVVMSGPATGRALVRPSKGGAQNQINFVWAARMLPDVPIPISELFGINQDLHWYLPHARKSIHSAKPQPYRVLVFC